MHQLAGRTDFSISKQRPRQAQSCLDCIESSSQVAPIWQEERAHLPETSKISNKQTTERDERSIHTSCGSDCSSPNATLQRNLARLFLSQKKKKTIRVAFSGVVPRTSASHIATTGTHKIDLPMSARQTYHCASLEKYETVSACW